jgi:hypothetical protein
VDNYAIKPQNPIKPHIKPVDNYVFDMWISICYDVYMTHDCSYALDLDGSVTCSICGAMDDDMDSSNKD